MCVAISQHTKYCVAVRECLWFTVTNHRPIRRLLQIKENLDMVRFVGVIFKENSLSKSELIDGKPLELVMRFVSQQDWFLHRTSRNEMMADVPGRWGHHQLYAEWHESEETLDVSCNLDISFDNIQLSEVTTLTSLLNQDLWLGHFVACEKTHTIKIKHKLMLRGAGGATPEQIEDIIEILLGEAEQAFPTIYQVLNGPYAARDIVPFGMIQSHGHA
ncbi:YbjN domain-containing protein [Alphaproteobacteria bacterium]|jgi:hypothetical protein|nr:hypothetical protein [Alphaproteobacteria bacterium]MDA9816145.1 YbjN domain-containing protein [Alphaproteobacteria bacterium]